MTVFLYVELQNAMISPVPIPSWQSCFDRWGETIASSGAVFGQDWEITLRLTDDREIQELNRQYRDKNTPTDVLAFAAIETLMPVVESNEPEYLGDIVIAIPTAARQAANQGHSLSRELLWLAAHGFLHLLGWDHPDEDSLQEMLAEQEVLLAKVGDIWKIL